MSARVGLAPEAIIAMYPSLLKLGTDCVIAKISHWGLRQHRRFPFRTTFGRQNRKWKLVVSLDQIFVCADEEYPQVGHRYLLFSYGVDVLTEQVVWGITVNSTSIPSLPLPPCFSRTSQLIRPN